LSQGRRTVTTLGSVGAFKSLGQLAEVRVLMTLATLKSYSHKDLVQLAKKGGVHGWHAMRKEQLVKALLDAAKSKSRKPTTPRAPERRSSGVKAVAPIAKNSHSSAPLHKPTSPRVLKHLDQVKAKLYRSKDISTDAPASKKKQPAKDRVVVMVRDPFWLHVYWELTRTSVERVAAAMNASWHLARPVLRLLEVNEGGTTSATERVVKDIEIHGGVSNWYIHVEGVPKSYRIEVGYVAEERFYGLVRSNVVTTPEAGSSDAIDEHWTDVAQNFDKIYAMSGGYSTDGSSTELQELFEERLRRPMGSPMTTRYGNGANMIFPASKDFVFEVDAELIIYGTCQPNAHVSVRGEPIRLRPDGSFTMRMSLPNQRQVIPAVACTPDGSEQRTIVLAIERNTKVMEPITREAED
jgi:hypothetical protein